MEPASAGSWLAFLQHEPNTSHGVYEPLAHVCIDLLSQSGDLDIDHVIERRRTPRLFPDLSREHFARHQMALVAQEVFQQLEFANRQIEETLTAHGPARDEIQLEIGRLETKNLRWTATPQQRTDTREQFRKGKRLDQVVIGAQIQTKHAILDAIARSEEHTSELQSRQYLVCRL